MSKFAVFSRSSGLVKPRMLRRCFVSLRMPLDTAHSSDSLNAGARIWRGSNKRSFSSISGKNERSSDCKHGDDGLKEKEGQGCWSCGIPVEQRHLFCPSCDTIQPPVKSETTTDEKSTIFSKFGLKRQFSLEPSDLEKAFHSLQKQLHPDKFGRKSDQEREYATDHSAIINEAYQTLKDPLSRAVYLLECSGVDALSEGGGSQADPSILMQAMEDREALEESTDVSELQGMRQDAKNRLAEIEARVEEAFESGDVAEATRATVELKYALKFHEEIMGKLAREFDVHL